MERIDVDTSTSLWARATRQIAMTLLVLAGLLFIPAGTWRFWQAWLYVGLMVVFWIYFLVDLMKNDPRLVQRRLQRKESEPQQRVLQRLFSWIIVPAFMLAGFDFRLGWSWRMGRVPLALVLVGQFVAVAGYWLVFWTFKTNSFASSTIQVEAEQRVIEHGPYKVVRHPMYLGMMVTAVGTPLALGSYVALPLFALFVPLLVYRLVYEERKLRRDLAGYADYCERTRFRVLPHVW
jgi:protein-S-isoprenylcysteine O-methyltransferase Ste14